MRVGAWTFCWGPSFWLFVAGGRGACLWCWFHQVKQGFAQIWRVKSRLCLSLWIFDATLSHSGCEMPWNLDPAKKHVWLLMVVCTWYSSFLARDFFFFFYLMPRTKFGSDTMLNNIIIISNAMCCTMLCMLEWRRKRKYRIKTLRTQGLRGSALTAYIYRGIL